MVDLSTTKVEKRELFLDYTILLFSSYYFKVGEKNKGVILH
jgi:hypothetical protein